MKSWIVGSMSLTAVAMTSLVRADWTFDSVGKTLIDDSGTELKAQAVSTDAQTIRVTGVTKLASTELDLSAVVKDAGGGVWTIVWISNKAFQLKSTITAVKLPETLEIIGDYAFDRATALTSIQPLLPSSVTNIGQQAFYDVPVSGALRLSNAALKTIPSQCFNVTVGDRAGLTSVDLSESGVLAINMKAFMLQTNIVSVSLPKKLEVLETGAFWNCYSLTTVTPFLPKTVRQLDGRSFSGVPVAGRLILSNPELTTIGANAFDVNDDNLPYAWLESVDMTKSGVRSISGYAFRGQRRLATLVFPKSLDSLSDYAFKNCTNLTHIYYANDYVAPPTNSKAFDGAIKKSKYLTVHALSGNATWDDYLAQHAQEISVDEQEAYQASHPGEKRPVALMPYPFATSSTLAYVSRWMPMRGLAIVIR